MTTNPTMTGFESTYAMLLRSEERERSASETLVYLLLILSAIFAVCQIAQQPFTVPTNLIHRDSITQSAAAPRPAV